MYIGPEMFREIRDRNIAKQIFALTVNRVEVEPNSYCNRRCSYCPNVIGDRIGENVRMSQDVWDMLLRDLGEIDYKKNVVLNYYNEPLSDRGVLDRIRELRARVPNCRIMIYTNGDYLDPSYVEELAAAGLNYMHVSIHLKRGDEYSDGYVVNRLIEIAVRMGIAARMVKIQSGEFMIAKAPHPKLEIEIRGINFLRHGTDRGGLIEEITTKAGRKDPCHFPFQHFVMSYNGLVAPCCHIRADRPEHEPYVIGDIRNFETIYQAFTSANAAAWRRELGGAQEKRSPCDTCAAGVLLDKNGEKALIEARHRFAGMDPAARPAAAPAEA